ncbi:MAG TPA: Rne/Rng family ribonuclease [Firmicutes bacterium]|nr:Rne/Rng family ribonuclease [Bacillota bacterium]
MKTEILVHATAEETWVAVLEDRVLMELYVDQGGAERFGGNIYKGRVKNVLPGMQAAFVDIGLERNAFLYVADTERKGKSNLTRNNKSANIKEVLQPGQQVVVQVVKEPTETKGARVSMHLSLPGRNLVLMPGADHVGVSRQIQDEKERERLRQAAGNIKPAGMGLIVRTVAAGMEEDEFAQDMDFLLRLHKTIKRRSRARTAPALLYRDLDLVYRIVRDLFTPSVDRFVVDSREVYERTLELLSIMGPELQDRVEYFEPGQDLLLTYALEADVEKTFRRKVWLKCGGYIVVDQTEALTAIDVNTGKFVGSTSLQATVLKTNLEAVKEIARQIRLRNIGGIIVVDFIDMDDPSAKNQVVQALEKQLRRDKVKAQVLGLTKLGLVEITRKKERRSLESVFLRPCPYCDGKGKILSEQAVGLKVRREIHRLLAQQPVGALLVEAHPSVAAVLIGPGGKSLKALEKQVGIPVQVRGVESLHSRDFALIPLTSKEELWAAAVPVRAGQVIAAPVEERHLTRTQDGVARVEGFVINVEDGAAFVGQTVRLKITKVLRTYAKAQVVDDNL